MLPCGTYADSEVYAPGGQGPPPPPPAGGALLEPPASLAAVRRFVGLRAEAAGLAGVRVALVETPANEALTWLPARGAADAELRVWEERGAVVCDVLAPGREAALPGPCAGFVPPGPEAGQHDGSGCCGVCARRWSCAATTAAARFRCRAAHPPVALALALQPRKRVPDGSCGGGAAGRQVSGGVSRSGAAPRSGGPRHR
ncbi:hypothetical protein [Streptomyces sp. NPDC001820]|uniref:hypothetical protein n=1 Tax=Streptomyces sp. NPDC001820 TaxID=3364613 RepID=UPI003681E4BA